MREMAGVVGVLLAILSSACGGPSTQTATSPAADAATRYVALVHNYWIQYKMAEGDIPTLIRVCGYYSSLSDVQPSVCRTRIAAILPPHEKFLCWTPLQHPLSLPLTIRRFGLNFQWQLPI